MTRLLLTMAGSYGVFLLYTAVALGWQGLGPARSGAGRSKGRGARLQDWLAQAGLDGVRPSQFVATAAVLWVAGTALTFALLGALLPAVAVGGFAATYPAVSYRSRRRRRRQRTAEAWPRMIEEMACSPVRWVGRCPRRCSRWGCGRPKRCARPSMPLTGSGC